MEETARVIEAIWELLDAGRDERLADLLAEAHPADVARAIRELPVKDQVRVFRLLTPQHAGAVLGELDDPTLRELVRSLDEGEVSRADRKSTRLNSSHLVISYAVFCLKKKKKSI